MSCSIELSYGKSFITSGPGQISCSIELSMEKVYNLGPGQISCSCEWSKKIKSIILGPDFVMFVC